MKKAKRWKPWSDWRRWVESYAREEVRVRVRYSLGRIVGKETEWRTITPLVRRKGSDEMSESLKRTKEAVRRLERDSRPKPGDGDLLVGRRKGRSK